MHETSGADQDPLYGSEESAGGLQLATAHAFDVRAHTGSWSQEATIAFVASSRVLASTSGNGASGSIVTRTIATSPQEFDCAGIDSPVNDYVSPIDTYRVDVGSTTAERLPDWGRDSMILTGGLAVMPRAVNAPARIMYSEVQLVASIGSSSDPSVSGSILVDLSSGIITLDRVTAIGTESSTRPGIPGSPAWMSKSSPNLALGQPARFWNGTHNLDLESATGMPTTCPTNSVVSSDRLSCFFQSVDVLPPCEDGWTTSVDGRSCLQYQSTARDWQAAQSNCQSKGAHLMTIKSSGAQLQAETLSGDVDIWIGLNDIDVEGTFRWVGDGTEPTGYTKWKPAQPSGGENCVELRPIYDWTWNDVSCSEAQSSICQRTAVLL